MLIQQNSASSIVTTYRRHAGDEPMPGYVLLEPLGKGGFGEVWKCEAPGGLHKAMKFVVNAADGEGGNSNSLEVEYEAFQHIKKIRHPFLLSLERVELIGVELMMVMELADQQLQDRFRAYTSQGYPGIPRDELLGYLADAAEMLDYIGSKHGLQHLDIKPANLFLVCDRVKVGDFGLVRRHELTPTEINNDRGLTPRYVAPEILHGRVDPRSDQYCLALVYQELLTGVFPYNARSAQQMMLQHVSAAPNLSPLPEADRFSVAKAMSKAPTDRFGSCVEFVRSLILGAYQADHDTVDGTQETWPGTKPAPYRTTTPDVIQARLPRTTVNFELPAAPPGSGVEPGALTGRMTQQAAGNKPNLTTQHRTMPQLNVPRKTVPTLSGRQAFAPARQDDAIELVALTATPAPAQIRLQRIWSILPVTKLLADTSNDFIAPDPAAVIESLVVAATPDGRLPKSVGIPVRQPDGTWTSSFPVRSISGISRIKLDLLRESWKAEIEQVGPEEFLIRRFHDGGMWQRWSGKKTGLIVHVKLPAPQATIGDAVLTGRLFGPTDVVLNRAAEELLPAMLQKVRDVLGNAEDRRRAIRIPTRWNVLLYPLTGDGLVGVPVQGRTRDLSTGGLCVVGRQPIDTAYVYTVFPELPGGATWALLTRLTRAVADPGGYIVAGRFRTDL